MKSDALRVTLLGFVTVFVFALIAVGAIIVFGYFAVDVFWALASREGVVNFNNGAMYLLGVGLTSGFLVFFMMWELMGKKITKSINAKASKYGLVFVGVIFIFPKIADYAVSYKVDRIGYLFCEKESYRWLHAQKKVFVMNLDDCDDRRR